LRRCIVTRERADPLTMLRFVVGPESTLVPDLARKLPGRGIWLSARADVLDTARTKGAFARAARGKVIVPPDLAAMIETTLLRRVVETLGLARRAGQAVCGFAKAREMIVAGRCELVVGARDGSADERDRLLSGAAGLKIVSPLDAATLGAAFGRDHIVHVAIAPGRLAGTIAIESERLAGFIGPVGTDRTFKQAGA
jgi:predicted RNA-binding protein YlxR (DUF448 family)